MKRLKPGAKAGAFLSRISGLSDAFQHVVDRMGLRLAFVLFKIGGELLLGPIGILQKLGTRTEG